jgi:hypothetical protein
MGNKRTEKAHSPAPTGRYSLAEEIAHATTHGAGLLLSIVGLVVLVVFATSRGDVWHIVSVAVFGATLVVLYAASTFYHALPSPKAKSVFRTLDHAAIYLLIAGTYTPFTVGRTPQTVRSNSMYRGESERTLLPMPRNCFDSNELISFGSELIVKWVAFATFLRRVVNERGGCGVA